MGQIAKLWHSESGATTIEYAAVASLISIVALAAIEAIGTSVASLWGTVPSF